MTPVEIKYANCMIGLAARNSELLILPEHVFALKALVDPKSFSQYFMQNALINRPARKLFESWLRKDPSVWPRLFTLVQKNIDIADFKDFKGGESKNT